MYLASGDLIDVVSPSFAVLPERLEAGVTALAAMGFPVRVGAHVLDRHGYLAGPDAARLDDLQRALDAEDSACVWFARGGYGVARLLDRVRLARPKLLIGHSDLTVLLHRAGLPGGRAAVPSSASWGTRRSTRPRWPRRSPDVLTLPFAPRGWCSRHRRRPAVGEPPVLAHALGRLSRWRRGAPCSCSRTWARRPTGWSGSSPPAGRRVRRRAGGAAGIAGGPAHAPPLPAAAICGHGGRFSSPSASRWCAACRWGTWRKWTVPLWAVGLDGRGRVSTRAPGSPAAPAPGLRRHRLRGL